jgi:hypothetical protein
MIILPLLLALTAQADPGADVLAPARQGMLRCTSPDPAQKTCSALTQFTFRPDGSFDADVTGVGGPAGIQVQYRVAGKLVDGAACFTHRANTLAEARFTKPGARLAPSLQDTLRAQLGAGLALLNGKQRCYRDRVEAGQLVSRTTLDGIAHPDLDRPVRWVSPDEAYKVE